MLLDIEKLSAHARERLTPERYRHSVAVQKRAVYLAGRYGADWYKAAVAGLLHDICHDMDYPEQLNYLHCCGILLDVLALENPPTWHAVAGARYIQDTLGIRDQDVVDAVRYHTTGRAEMTLLDKVVYIADLTSEDRTFPDIDKVRALSERSLDEAVRYSLCYTVEQLIHRGKPLIRDAWEAYNYYLLKEPENDIL